MVTVLMCCLEMSGNLCVTGCYILLFLCIACWILWLTLWHNSEHLCVFWWLLNIFCFWWLFTELCLKSCMSFVACFIVFFYSRQVSYTVSSVMHIHVLCLSGCSTLLQFTMTLLAAVHCIVLQGAVICCWYCSYISATVSVIASSLHIIMLQLS